MNATIERLQIIILELGDLRAKAKTSREYDLADETLTALRAKWEKYCTRNVIAVEIKTDDLPWGYLSAKGDAL